MEHNLCHFLVYGICNAAGLLTGMLVFGHTTRQPFADTASWKRLDQTLQAIMYTSLQVLLRHRLPYSSHVLSFRSIGWSLCIFSLLSYVVLHNGATRHTKHTGATRRTNCCLVMLHAIVYTSLQVLLLHCTYSSHLGGGCSSKEIELKSKSSLSPPHLLHHTYSTVAQRFYLEV